MNSHKQIQNSNAGSVFVNVENFAETSRNAANFPDLFSLAVHRLAAERLREKPKLLETAKTNLRNWMDANPNVPAWLEWKMILETENLVNILKIITAETDEGQRLRSSSPFAGLITKEERRQAIEICAEAKPF